MLFHEVFRGGGFDLVLANPPYVRQEKLSADDQQVFEQAFPEVYRGTADLLVFFYARALQILRPGGWLAFVTSNKYMRAGYGSKLRAHLPNSLALARIVDMGDLPLFDSNGKSIAAYPSVLIGRRGPAAADHTLEVADLSWPVRRQLAREGKSASPEAVRESLTGLDQLLHASATRGYPQALLRRDGWILEDPALIRLFDRLMSQGTPLGEYTQGRIYRGIITGLNDAFVIDQATRDALVAADPRSAEIIEPWLRGRDIERWTAQPSGRYLLRLQNSGDTDSANPWAKAGDEAAARRIFAAAYPAVHDHLRRFEDRLRPRADQGRYWWELRACAYYAEFERPKVIFKHFISSPDFSFDQSGMYLNNACTFASVDSPAVAAFACSQICWWMLNNLTTRLQNGFIQLFVSHIKRLPIPELDVKMEEELSASVSQLLVNPRDRRKESVVEAMVADAYGLSQVELRLIQEWFLENSASVSQT